MPFRGGRADKRLGGGFCDITHPQRSRRPFSSELHPAFVQAAESRKLASVSEPAPRRFARLRRKGSAPSDRAWKRSELLEPRPAPADPELVSDGGGLPFPPAALVRGVAQLDPSDPAVDALIALIARQKTARSASGAPLQPDASPAAAPNLEGWRLLARTDSEVLFGRGLPPRLLTVAMHHDAKRDTWTSVSINTSQPLRSTRDGIRGSRWRPDPTREADPDETVLRVLVTEQTFAGGKRADGRLLAPDLYVGADKLVLTMFVAPRPGFQTRSRNPETPARVALPCPIGTRALIDGALYPRPVPGTPA